MKTNKFFLILTFSLLTSVILIGCGTQSAPEPVVTQAPQSSDPEPVPATQAASVSETEAPAEIPAEAPAATVSFANDVLPIIESRCVNCHGGRKIEEGLLMRTYDEIMAGSDNGPVVAPGDTTNSLLVELITKKEMPKKGPKLTPPQVQIITDWVAAGAPNN